MVLHGKFLHGCVRNCSELTVGVGGCFCVSDHMLSLKELDKHWHVSLSGEWEQGLTRVL